MKCPKPLSGYADRGLLAPAYLTAEQESLIQNMQPSLIKAWNWLVKRQEEALEAQKARALRLGLIGPTPEKPDYKSMGPEESKQAKEDYNQVCSDRLKKLFDLKECPVEWRPHLAGKASEAERLGFKQDYQVINWYLRSCEMPELPAAILQSLVKNFSQKAKGMKRKKFRKSWEVMPIQVRSGQQLRLRINQANDNWLVSRCNAEVFLPAVGWIAVYLDSGLMNKLLTPGNTVREGCTLRFEAGKWYASVKLIQPIPNRTGPNNGKIVGIDPGLANIATWDDGSAGGELKNHRNLKYIDARSTAISIADLLIETVRDHKGEEAEFTRQQARDYKQQVYSHDARQRRRTLTQCRQLAAFISSNYQYVGFEKNQGIALGIGSRYLGATKILYNCLLDKCGPDRVREVESFYNSQDCSQCGQRSKITWERKLGQKDQMCQCATCGLYLDRDRNAARNVRRKMMESLPDLKK